MRRKGQQIYLDEGDWCDITSIPPKERRVIFPQIPSWFFANKNKYCILWGTGEADSGVDSYNSDIDYRSQWIKDMKDQFGATNDISIILTDNLGDW